MGCDELTSVVIGDNVTSIGSFAFLACNKLTSVVIGKSVTEINATAFFIDNLSNVHIYYSGTEEEWTAITGSSHLTRATIHYNHVPEE